MKLYKYQQILKEKIIAAWEQVKNVLAVLPTGGGKTVLFSSIIKDHKGVICAIAHRKELVSQMSLALAREGVFHRVIGQDNLIRLINQMHMEELGTSFYHPNALTAVASVDTLVSWAKNTGQKGKNVKRWAKTVTLWVMDEGHHILKSNKWGQAVALFVNAKGLSVTATPERADGKGLGAEYDGVAETMVEGPKQRDLIRMGFLSDYKIFAPQSDLDLSDIQLGKDGDITRSSAKKAVRRSKIIGDVVTQYLKIAPGKKGITFVPDIETANDIAARFNLFGIPAAAIDASTPDPERVELLRQFRKGRLMMLVNVDIFGEGFDLPSIEVVILARPTMSFSVFVQQCGRALRIMDGKEYAIIIDHVGNVARHAKAIEENGELIIDLCRREWSLAGRQKTSRGKDEDEIPIRSCLNPSCMQDYPAVYPQCPYCGYKPIPSVRSAPEFVDGDLTELDPLALSRLVGGIIKVDETPQEYLDRSNFGMLPKTIVYANLKRHSNNQEAQKQLRESMACWAGWQKAKGWDGSERDRLFFFEFGIDKISAQALKRKEAEELKIRIDQSIIITYDNYYNGEKNEHAQAN